jgi:hypothetical protein
MPLEQYYIGGTSSHYGSIILKWNPTSEKDKFLARSIQIMVELTNLLEVVKLWTIVAQVFCQH